MMVQNGIAMADPAARPLRTFVRDILRPASSSALVLSAIAALGATWAIARYAPGAWLGGVLAYSIAAGLLAALSDRRIAMLRVRTGSRGSGARVSLGIIRLFATGIAMASAIAFVLFGVAALMGSIGAGGG